MKIPTSGLVFFNVTLSNAYQFQAKALWSNEVLDGCSKNPAVSKTKE